MDDPGVLQLINFLVDSRQPVEVFLRQENAVHRQKSLLADRERRVFNVAFVQSHNLHAVIEKHSIERWIHCISSHFFDSLELKDARPEMKTIR